MGEIVVIIATNISTALNTCDATSITEIAPMYNSELMMLDTMLLASNKFLFILFCFLVFKKERKVPKERKNLFFISLMYRLVIQLNVLGLINVFLSYIYIRCIYVYNRKDSSINING